MKNITHIILKWEGGKNGNPILFLPEYNATCGRIVCYQHIGQHSEADMSYYWGLRNPKDGEQMNKAKELFSEYQSNNPEEVFKVVKQDREKFRKERYSHAS